MVIEGTLTYLEYSSNKSYTMPADVDKKQLNKSKSFIFSNLYPDKPKANSSDTLTISKDGFMVSNKTVRSIKKWKMEI